MLIKIYIIKFFPFGMYFGMFRKIIGRSLIVFVILILVLVIFFITKSIFQTKPVCLTYFTGAS